MAPKTSSATLRLKQDYARLKNDPVPFVVAEPNPSNILEWYVRCPCEADRSSAAPLCRVDDVGF